MKPAGAGAHVPVSAEGSSAEFDPGSLSSTGLRVKRTLASGKCPEFLHQSGFQDTQEARVQKPSYEAERLPNPKDTMSVLESEPKRELEKDEKQFTQRQTLFVANIQFSKEYQQKCSDLSP